MMSSLCSCRIIAWTQHQVPGQFLDISTVQCLSTSWLQEKRIYKSHLAATGGRSHNFSNAGKEQRSPSPGPSQLPLPWQQSGLLPIVPQQSEATWLTLTVPLPSVTSIQKAAAPSMPLLVSNIPASPLGFIREADAKSPSFLLLDKKCL